jgi:hypothetical protein
MIRELFGLKDRLTARLGKRFANETRMTGRLRIEHRGPTGELLTVRVLNAVTTAGKAGAADQILASPTLAKPTHMAVGTGSPGANALGGEIDRNALTSKTRSTNVVTMVGDWAAGDGTGAITEAGTFDDPAVGNMWTSASFAVVNKGALDTLSISWTLTFS